MIVGQPRDLARSSQLPTIADNAQMYNIVGPIYLRAAEGFRPTAIGIRSPRAAIGIRSSRDSFPFNSPVDQLGTKVRSFMPSGQLVDGPALRPGHPIITPEPTKQQHPCPDSLLLVHHPFTPPQPICPAYPTIILLAPPNPALLSTHPCRDGWAPRFIFHPPCRCKRLVSHPNLP